MLNRARWRMILSAMAAVSAVLIALVALINVANYCATTGRVDGTLSTIIDFEESKDAGFQSESAPLPLLLGMPDRESSYSTRFFTVSYDGAGAVDSVSIDYVATVDSSVAINYAEQALASGRTRGYLDDYRFAISRSDGATTVAFLNAASEQEAMRSLLVLSTVIALISLAFVFLLLVLLSKRAMRPFEQNLEQQKRFATDASHELKTPLTSISASLDVLSLERGEDEWTANIRSQTERMTKLVGDLVALSRLDESDRIAVEEEFSVSDAAWETAEAFISRAKAQGKQFDVDVMDGLSMRGDKQAVQQMMSALLDNAVRYSDDGGSIRLRVERKKGHIAIEVFNTCRLAEPLDTVHIFDRFYRPGESRSRKASGSGIGLAIAKAVTERHNGSISASCPTGESMTVKVLL